MIGVSERVKHGERMWRRGEIPVDWRVRWYLLTGHFPDGKKIDRAIATRNGKRRL